MAAEEIKNCKHNTIGHKYIGGFAGHEHSHPVGPQVCFDCEKTIQEIITTSTNEAIAGTVEMCLKIAINHFQSALSAPVFKYFEDDLRSLTPTAAQDWERKEISGGATLIYEERIRQIAQEGWSSEHDDSHIDGVLSVQAAALAVDGTDAFVHDPNSDPPIDPFGLVKKHHGNRMRELVIAGALIAAEIDRLQRLATLRGERKESNNE